MKHCIYYSTLTVLCTCCTVFFSSVHSSVFNNTNENFTNLKIFPLLSVPFLACIYNNQSERWDNLWIPDLCDAKFVYDVFGKQTVSICIITVTVWYDKHHWISTTSLVWPVKKLINAISESNAIGSCQSPTNRRMR